MKYELTVYVTVSAASEREACDLVAKQLEGSPRWRASDVTYLDAEATTATPECCDCGALLIDGSTDYTLCSACAKVNDPLPVPVDQDAKINQVIDGMIARRLGLRSTIVKAGVK